MVVEGNEIQNLTVDELRKNEPLLDKYADKVDTYIVGFSYYDGPYSEVEDSEYFDTLEEALDRFKEFYNNPQETLGTDIVDSLNILASLDDEYVDWCREHDINIEGEDLEYIVAVEYCSERYKNKDYDFSDDLGEDDKYDDDFDEDDDFYILLDDDIDEED